MGGDRIRVTGIQVRARHGVYAEEKLNDQLFVVDLDCRVRRTSDADDLDTTVDYAALTAEVAACVRAEPVDLIETLAERVAGVCLAHAGIRRVSVTVHKPEAALPERVADVSVRVRRSRQS